jgi:hypothetical protein
MPRGDKIVSRFKWELASSPDKNYIFEVALTMGWAENKVQVRQYKLFSKEYTYAIEPFEGECNCPNILKYDDYFIDGKRV